MEFTQTIIFIAVILVAFTIAFAQYRRIYLSIKMGKPEKIDTSFSMRFRNMLFFALGQKKMFRKPLVAFLHACIYVAFLITQIELIEIFADGFTGHHRLFFHAWQNSAFGLAVYFTVISGIEVLSVLAFFATLIFLARRNLLKVPRFVKPEMKGWPKMDGNIILYLEIVLIIGIFCMNAADAALHPGLYKFLISANLFAPMLSGMSQTGLQFIEQFGWWLHILVVLAFLNYLPVSKHLHIILSFFNAWFTRPEPVGHIANMPAISREIQLMMDPQAAAETPPNDEPPASFGAKDITDLSWKNLLDAFTCTECGRCTAACPANLTGKKLSPRKIMMDVRDRMEDLSDQREEKGVDFKDDKSLVGDYISSEELRACTTCNACVQECPVNISPLSIIQELRRYQIMELSDAPEEWTMMFNNIENNAAPWQYAQADRYKWADEMNQKIQA